jgi:hypothetical protein
MDLEGKKYALNMLRAAHSNPSNPDFEGAAMEVDDMLKGGDITASFERGQWCFRDGFDGEILFFVHASIFVH